MQPEDQKFNNFAEERRAGWSDLSYDIQYIKRDIAEIKQTIKEGKEDFVSRAEFAPIKQIVYGLVGLILTGVVGALLTLIIRQ